MKIRAAQTNDYQQIAALLQAAKLPVDGVCEHLSHFSVLEEGDQIIGAVGLEIYGQDALLRSMVVAEKNAETGLGELLYQTILREAKQAKLTNLYLLTETAEAFFAKKGFVRIDRATVTSPVAQSVEFISACPASAACMHLPVSQA